MSDAMIAVLLLVPYAIFDQWAFRCQRVGRGILLLAKDGAATHPELFSSLMPTRFVATVWLSRLLWLSGAIFAWRAWGWLGLIGVFLYGFVLGAVVDGISPWPSYARLLKLVRERVESGAAGYQGIVLLSHIDDIERQLAKGVHFEKATTGAWISRSSEAQAQVKAPLEEGANR